MSSKKYKIPLTMQCHDLSSLEFRHRGEESLEHPSDSVSEASDEAV
jgi:hypothetical protein